MPRYRARYIIVDGIPQQGWELDVRGGRIHRVGPQRESARDDVASDEVIDLGDVALTAGLVNAHSHAFQRAIRGHTEWLRAGRVDEDFWTWREAMYGAALSYSPEEVEAVALRAYKEMARTGITHVGEFHYLHHDRDGNPYEDPNELAHRVIRAAREAGLRITLLRVAYNRAGHNRAADPMQRRFLETDCDTYIERLEALTHLLDVVALFLLTELLLNRLELLTQQHLALPLTELRLDLGLDVLLSIDPGELPFDCHQARPHAFLIGQRL